MVKVSTERLPESQIALQIEVDDERLERAMDSAYRRLATRVKIPGFRPGKAPRAVVERHVGEDAIRQEAIDRLMPELYKEALAQESIEPIDRAIYELVQEQPLVAKFTVPVRPSTDLGDYHSLRLAKDPVVVEPEKVDEGLQALRQRYATLEPVTRPIQWDDVVRADVEGTVDGRPIAKEQDAEFQLTEGRTISLPGFAEALIGRQKGDQFDFEVAIPEDVSDQALRGKQARYHVRIKETKQLILPELDGEFARQVGEGFETLAALRTRVEDDLREALEREAEHRYHEQALGALVEQAKLEYPPVLAEREVDRLLEEQTNDARPSGRTGERLERYLGQIGKSEEEVRAELRPLAETRLRRSLVLAELAEAEHIEVTDAEVEAEIDRLASGAGSQAEELRRLFSGERAREGLGRSLRTRKTFERLAQIASGAQQEAGAEEAEAGAAEEG
jgi:trigger factor